MLKHIQKLFATANGEGDAPQTDDPLQTAIAALLIEAAFFDGHFDTRERQQILKLLQTRFTLTEQAAGALIENVQAWAENPNNLHRFTKTVKDVLPHDERVELIEMLWEVVYADGKLDDFEANLLRRIGGLLYVSDQERGGARKRVLKRLGIDESERPE
ncbi:MAG: TerB family tellurite resistance protein [Alphaproteobacteria bacterium]|nr:TerB family tellurite resistance protein [Alphaproteobacteria bacterium]